MSAPVPLDAERVRVVDLLSSHFAHDTISVEELDRRLDAAYRAGSVQELEALVRDLPKGATAVARVSTGVPAYYESEEQDEDTAGEESERIMSIMAETHRAGLWVVPRHLDVVAVMATTVLDLRRASLAPGVTTIRLSSLMAQVKIVVPAGVRVVDRTSAFMATTRNTTDVHHDPGPADPVLRIEGWTVMAEVVIERS